MCCSLCNCHDYMYDWIENTTSYLVKNSPSNWIYIHWTTPLVTATPPLAMLENIFVLLFNAQLFGNSLIVVRMIGRFWPTNVHNFNQQSRLPKGCPINKQKCNQQLWWIQITKYFPNTCPTFVPLFKQRMGKPNVCPTRPIICFVGQLSTNNCWSYFAQQMIWPTFLQCRASKTWDLRHCEVRDQYNVWFVLPGK